MIHSSDKPLQTVFITGCSVGGIGSALAEAFHARGLHVFATARSLSKMSHLEKLPNLTLLELDVESRLSISTALKSVRSKTDGKLDFLVNNAGKACVRPALDTEIDPAKRLFDVNFWGVAEVTKAFAPLIIASKGTIVNISSIAAGLHPPWGGEFSLLRLTENFSGLILDLSSADNTEAYYNASKAALKEYSETLRLEMGPLEVRVVTVMAGVVETRIFANHHNVELPEDSLWKAASKEINDIATGVLMKGSMPASLFAKYVADDALEGANGFIWRGKMSTIGWCMRQFFPSWLMDRAVIFGSGLEHMA